MERAAVAPILGLGVNPQWARAGGRGPVGTIPRLGRLGDPQGDDVRLPIPFSLFRDRARPEQVGENREDEDTGRSCRAPQSDLLGPPARSTFSWDA